MDRTFTYIYYVNVYKCHMIAAVILYWTINALFRPNRL